MPEESIAALEQRRAHLCRQLASIGEMRSGSLMARCRRYGKTTGCGCAPPGKAQRGPVLSLTCKQSGKTAPSRRPTIQGRALDGRPRPVRLPSMPDGRGTVHGRSWAEPDDCPRMACSSKS